jgi:hypothetical protein
MDKGLEWENKDDEEEEGKDGKGKRREKVKRTLDS